MSKILAIILLSAGLTVSAESHELTFDECLEGSDFILQAAKARDGGVSREKFMSRIHADLIAIQKFPPELRWFVQDKEDERFLVDASTQVYDVPRRPQSHQSDFLMACVGQMTPDEVMTKSKSTTLATKKETRRHDAMTGNPPFSSGREK